MPEVGNLAWAPLTAIEEVEIFDRHNGVPTLGIIRTRDHCHLFWRALGYTGDISLWLYVPLDADDLARIDDEEGAGLLEGIVHNSATERFATIGVADYHRIIFEREWKIPARAASEDVVRHLIDFAYEALSIALREDLPPSRRGHVAKAQEAVQHLTV
jgi:hypothetical protein